MKKIIFLLIIICSAFSVSYADEYNEIIDEYIGEYSREIENGIRDADVLLMPDFDAGKIIRDASEGKTILSFEKIGNIILNIMLPEFRTVSKSILYLISVTLVGSFLLNLQNSDINGGAQKAGSFFIILVSAGIIANIFSNISVITFSSASCLSLFL